MNITNEYQMNVFLKERTIYINGEINQQLANEIAEEIDILDTDDDELPIKVKINSGGGDVSAGLLIYDAMNHAKAPITMLCTSLAASMAAVLLSAADKRLILPNANVMIHQASTYQGEGYNTIFEMRDKLELLEKANRSCIKILAENTNHTEKEIEDLTFKKDYWLSAEEAVKFGIVDEIIK